MIAFSVVASSSVAFWIESAPPAPPVGFTTIGMLAFAQCTFVRSEATLHPVIFGLLLSV